MIGEIIARHPRVVVAVILFTLLVSGYYASQMKIGVSTGRFELKNEQYRLYNKILKTFGTEKDNVIVVGISRDGYILGKNDILNILNFEKELNRSIKNMDIQSVVDYILTGIYILNFQNKLPRNLNLSIDYRVWEDINKIKDAISNYEYLNHTSNDTLRKSAYSVFILLPKVYRDDFFNSTSYANFSYPLILNQSRYNATRYNATTMLIDEIEIYQNLSAYSSGNVSMGMEIPERYNLEFVNRSIMDAQFNITYARIGTQDYNESYVEWYIYNISFGIALSSMYAGYDNLALTIYRGDKSSAENRSEENLWYYMRWKNYSENLTLYLHHQRSTDDMINDTEFMENISSGIVRDYLSNYSNELERYSNGSLSWETISRRTRYTQNVSLLQMNYTAYCRDKELELIPYLDRMIHSLESGERDYDDALKLIEIATLNLKEIRDRIILFYGEYLIYGKVLNILENLRDILLRDESDDVKQAAWDLIKFSTISTLNLTGDVTPLYHALKGYRETIFTPYEKNTTKILWDYMSLQQFRMPDVHFNNITLTNYTREMMMEDVRNYTQEDINRGFREIKDYRDDSTEILVRNYTSNLNNLSLDIEFIESNLSYISSRYRVLGGEDAENFTRGMGELMEEINNYSHQVGEGINASYSLRMIEDFFEIRDSILNTLLSKDEISTVLMISIDNSSYENKIHGVAKNSSGVVEYHTLATNVLVREIEETAKHDMATFIPIAIVILVILLLITYGNVINTLLSLSAVLIVLVWLFAFATIVGWDFDPITLAVPIMLIGIGIDDGIYVTLRYMEERETRDRVKSTVITISSVGGALLLTTLTSMAGFLSNTISSMEDLQRFGFLAAIGLLFSFIVMNVYLPAVNMLIDTRKKKRKKYLELRFSQLGANIALKNPYIMILVAGILAMAGVISLGNISTEFNIKDLAPQNSEIIEYYHYYERNFNATVELSYIYMEGNLTSPAVLRAMAQTQANIEDDGTVVHDYPILSPWSIMEKYAHAKKGEIYYNETFIKAFEASDIDHDGFPDRNITELYRMLKPEISSVLQGDVAIMIVHTDSHDLKRVNELYNELSKDAQPLRRYVKVKIAGDAIVGKASIDEINENQIRSLFLSVLSALVMLVILFRIVKGSYVLGIIAALPIMMVVTWNWLLMYVLGISLNVMTNTIASLCVGLGVDYGIHITHRFVEESSRYYRIRDALLRATGRMGRGMIGASTTTIASIGILTLSRIPPLSNFALILSFSILFAFIASLIVLPSLLVLWVYYRRKHGYDRLEMIIKDAKAREDYATLCKYHISDDYCLLYAYSLIKNGKIAEARKVINELSEEGINLEDLLHSQSVDPRFE